MQEKGAFNYLWYMRINLMLMVHTELVFLVWEKLLFLLSNMAAVTSAAVGLLRLTNQRFVKMMQVWRANCFSSFLNFIKALFLT